MDRNTAKAERLEQSQANLEKIVEAAKPLYASLNAAQKHTFIKLGRMLVPERGQFAKEIRRSRPSQRGIAAAREKREARSVVCVSG